MGESSGAVVGEQGAFTHSAPPQGVETWGRPRKDVLLRPCGGWDPRIHQKEEPGLGSSPSSSSPGSSTGAGSPPTFLVLCWEVWGGAHSAPLACPQVAPTRSSSTPSSGHWTGQGFCATRPSSCHSWKPRTTPATSTVSRCPRSGRGVCLSSHPGPRASNFLNFPRS